jgi:hypothetical protein
LPNYSGARTAFGKKGVPTSAVHADPSLSVVPTTQARYASPLVLPAESDDSRASRQYDTTVSHPMDAI